MERPPDAIQKYLSAMKERTGMSWADLSAATRLPDSTIRKIFSGETADPRLETISLIVSAMGGSLGDISPGASGSPAPAPRDASSCISLLQAQIADLKRTRMILSIAVAVTVFVILLALILDVFNGGIGYIRF